MTNKLGDPIDDHIHDNMRCEDRMHATLPACLRGYETDAAIALSDRIYEPLSWKLPGVVNDIGMAMWSRSRK